MFSSLEQVKEFNRENGVEMVDFKMTDIDGRWRHILIPEQRLTEDTLKFGIGFDGSNYGYAPVENSDMVFIPDLSTAALDPFAGVPTLTMTGDVMIIDTPENRPFDQYPRNVAKRALEYMCRTGIADEMLIGPEFEFYMFDSVSCGVSPSGAGYRIDSAEAEWNSGAEFPNNGYQTPRKGGYHIDKPQDITSDLRSRMCLLMEKMGVGIRYHHHEVGGCGQLEIEVELCEMSKMADDTMIIKYIIKNAAAEAGKTATFMPKPVCDEAGSGMHVHMQLFKNGEPLFYDENGYAQLSKEALWFIGGLLSHAGAICAITNPSTNSFRRLVPGFEAPVTIGYATANRSAVVRIPAYAKSPRVKRFELRNPDATCNPYYAYSAILMAGLDGIENRIDPHEKGWGPFDFNLFDLPDEEKAKLGGLPKSLEEALDALESDHEFLTRGGVFPQRLIDIWIKRKRAEAEAISRVPHPAEFKKYYDL